MHCRASHVSSSIRAHPVSSEKRTFFYCLTVQFSYLLANAMRACLWCSVNMGTFRAILPNNFSSTKRNRIVRSELAEELFSPKTSFFISLDPINGIYFAKRTMFLSSRRDVFLCLDASGKFEVV